MGHIAGRDAPVRRMSQLLNLFDGNVRNYKKFKEQWRKIQKTGIGDKKLMKILWEYSLPHITENAGRFADITAVWVYLDTLFE
jgi:hypothetical protein